MNSLRYDKKHSIFNNRSIKIPDIYGAVMKVHVITDLEGNDYLVKYIEKPILINNLIWASCQYNKLGWHLRR
ncbi:MAG: hypothetical protein QOK72_03860 [Nitrososphaeraceae archaeon]|nr:hypothetical protein [Nitrososphaeraceae archaeon]